MAKQKISNYVFLPGVGSTTNLYPNAYSIIQANYDFIKAETIAYINANITTDNASNLYPNAVTLLSNNRTFIIDEIQAWIAAQVAAAGVGTTWYGYTYNVASCRRDLGYLLDAYTYDIRFGGNEQTIFIAKTFWLGGTAQLISPTQETLGFNQVINIINNYVLPKTLYTSQQSPVVSIQNRSGSSAEAGVTTLISALGTIISNVIAGGLSTLPTTTYSSRNFAGYVYDSTKCNRDIGYVLDAYVNDIRYGGNAQTRFIASRFWHGDVPQIGGDRKPEITAETFLRNLVINTILPKSASYVPYQVTEPLIRTMTVVAETGSYARVTTLSNIIINVITNGLSSLPALSNGVTTIKVQGKYKLEQLLLITNSTSNTILYNFSDPQAGAKVDYFSTTNTGIGDPYSDDFPAFRNTADYVTTLTLVADTSSASVSDDIQIFYEAKETKVRPYDFGTDAIERHRVAQAQSMLDADFEYGLQPTKWQAIGLSRGYPSVYELPGTDTSVLTVTTDASTGTGGVGESLITVTTQSAHGFLTGTPITIRSLANTITGFSRAEGTFIVNSVGTPTTFTYYATAKVGTTNGQVLATTYSQLRKGAFYTGAGVSTPTFSVYSNGASGTFTTKFITATATDQIAVTSALPPVGTPVTGTGILAGTQISGTVGSSGLAVTANIGIGANIGDSAIDVANAAGILEGMAIDNGTGVSVFVTNVTGTTVSLTGQLTAAKPGGTQTYLNISSTNIANTGSGATFDITRTAGVYSIDTFTGGSSYRANERVLVLGTDLGGTSPLNDAYVTITGVDGSGIITTATIAGSGVSASDLSFTGVPSTLIAAAGSGASFDITRASLAYGTALINLAGINYRENERVKILGTSLGGATPANDATILITAVDGTGGITAFSTSGVGASGTSIDFYSAISLSAVTTTQIADATSLTYAAIATVQITFPYTHGLVPGASVSIDITSAGTNHALAKGPFYIDAIPNKNTIRYTARAVGTIDTGTSLIGNIYCRSDSYFIHRPYDGGVQLGTGGPVHGGQAIRMSKKYIRYQSGKGINYCTGALFAPSYNIQGLSATGTSIGSYITITTDDVDHGCQPGGRIKINGIDTKGYDGTYVVSDIIDERNLRVQATTVLASVSAILTTNAQLSVLNWHGSTVRAGTFDDQNGLFFFYDGQTFGVGRRSATFQLAGTISVAKDSNYVTGTNSRFRDQVKAGDRIVIKGMTHIVTGVDSNTVMYINPDYRGATNAVNAKACLVQEFIIPQSQFNLDKIDGTGPSGYKIDVTKMQMIGMQWSWYAVGFIDFMLRGSDGNFVFFHRIRNSNVNTEAYMRTGNMPVRYEVQNESGRSSLFSSITATQTTIPLVDASGFPNESGVVYIDNEMISFSGKSGNTLTGCTRGTVLTNFTGGAQRTFTAGPATTHEYNTGVILISCTISPIISHWGSAMLTDGQFDTDRGYLFNYASTGIQVSTTKQTAFMIRLAPSVSNAQIGDLGDRELINRAQLLLKGIEVTSDTGTGGLVVEGVLNPSNFPSDPGSITWSGLSSQAAGGQPSFAQVAPGGSISWAGGSLITNSTATTATTLFGGSTVPSSALFASASGSNIVYVTQASWEAMGGSAGIAVSTANIVILTGTATISTISGAGTLVSPWSALITGTVNTVGLSAGMTLTATSGTGTLFGGTPTSVTVVSFVASTSITYAVVGGTTPTAGNITNLAVVGETRFSAGTTVSSAVINTTPVATTLPSLNALVFVPNNTGFNVGANNNFVYILQTSWTSVFSNTDPIGVKITSTDFPAGTTITQVTGPGNFNGFSYYQVILSQNSTVAHNANSSMQVGIGGAVTSGNTLLFTQSSWNALPIGANQVGNSTNDVGKFSNGTQISTVSGLTTFNNINYYKVTFNTNLLATVADSASVTFAYTQYYTLTMSRNNISAVPVNAVIVFTPAILSPATSFLYFTKTSWEALVSGYTATAGTEVDDAAKFPSGTKISSITTLQTFAGNQYYRVNFTQSSITTIGTSIAVTFKFGLPAYAQPGETVFSFIASPGSNGTLDLSDLKELTNTTLGGRGTYPNGPDVLAINVFKTSGTAISTNVIIRWGEAQA